MPHDLIVFGEDWGGHPSSTQHIVKRLAGDRKTVWVNSLGLRRPRLDRADLGRLFEKARRLVLSGRGDRQAPGQHPFAAVVDPRALPFPGSRAANFLNGRLLARQIGSVARQHGLRRPVLWLSLPSAAPVIGRLGERAVVYYAGDDFGALSGVDHAAVLALEAAVAGKAQLIIAASEAIAERFPASRTVVVPHGVDYALFSCPAPPAAGMPSGKVAGYYGSISDWIDVEAIAAAARALADWTFVMIGRVTTDVSALSALANVRFEGAKPHAELASWSQHWTVSLAPFRNTRQIEASNPLKLREYLAAGRPIAATRFFPAARPYGAHIHVGDGMSGLAGAILAAAADDSSPFARRAMVADETWDRRTRQIAELIDSL